MAGPSNGHDFDQYSFEVLGTACIGDCGSVTAFYTLIFRFFWGYKSTDRADILLSLGGLGSIIAFVVLSSREKRVFVQYY